MNLKSMSVNKLLKLRQQVEAALSSKITEHKRQVKDQLTKLERLGETALRSKGGRAWLRGPVPPKYRNPENPAETWAGRGLRPRWLTAALKSGKKLEHFSISPPAKKGGAKPIKRRKARA